MNSDNETKKMPVPPENGARNQTPDGVIHRRRPADKDKTEIGWHNLAFLLLFPIVCIYYEFVLHISLFSNLSGSFFAYSVLFGIPTGLIFALICSIFPKKVNYWVTTGVLFAITVYFGVQLVYQSFFGDFFYWDLLSVGSNIWQFWRETVSAIWSDIIPLILLFVPPVCFMIFGRRIIKPLPMSWTLRAAGLVLILAFFFGGKAFVSSHDDMMGDSYLYNEGFQMTDATSKFGLFTSARLDTQYYLFGHSDDVDEEITRGDVTTQDWGYLFGTTTEKTVETASPVSQPAGESTAEVSTEPEVTTEPVDTSPNVMDIDFDALIASSKTTAEKNAHTWFSSRTPTNKNEYTGMFEGKNLIWITVESWAPAAINETLTPTLWKMKNEGFVFENFYCSLWGGSTATGEYADITGNFYNSADCLKKSASTLEKFTAGNVFKSLGYKCLAFHDWTATYYSRDKSHPNFGYEYYGTVYKSSGSYPGTSGWDVLFTRAWPLSDLELANNTVSYIPSDGSKFHIYYMTVSGHPLQTYSGNSQARKHKLDVSVLSSQYSCEYALSYIASEYEVELMVSKLIEELDAKGVLNDTVFVMSPDHYPYNITADANGIVNDDSLNVIALGELYGLEATNDIFVNPELYKAPLIIWSPSMTESVTVTKVCSAIDILPTVLNLFGCEYDSRLIMGQDILSDSPGFVILNMSNRSGTSSYYNWVTDYGYYSNKTKEFTPASGVSVDLDALKASGYITTYTTRLNEMYTYSKYILEKDYYRMVFPNG